MKYISKNIRESEYVGVPKRKVKKPRAHTNTHANMHSNWLRLTAAKRNDSIYTCKLTQKTGFAGVCSCWEISVTVKLNFGAHSVVKCL